MRSSELAAAGPESDLRLAAAGPQPVRPPRRSGTGAGARRATAAAPWTYGVASGSGRWHLRCSEATGHVSRPGSSPRRSATLTATGAGPRERVLLGSHDGRVFLGSNDVALVADAFRLVALPGLVLDLTGRASAWGRLLTLQATAQTLLLPVGGALSDRVACHRVIGAARALQGLLTAGLVAGVASGRATSSHLDLYAVAAGAGYGLLLPALFSMTPELVAAGQVRAANSLVHLASSLARLAGPVLAGVAAESLGGGPTLAVAVAFFIASAASVATIRPHPRERAAKAPLVEQLREGLRVARRDRLVATLLGITPLLFLGYAGPVFVGFPALAREALAAGPRGLGLLYSAVGVGSVAGALLASRGSGPRPPVVRAALGVIGSGLGLAGAGAADRLWTTAAVLTVSASLASAAVLTFLTLVQLRAGEAARARILSLVILGASVACPVSYAAAAALVSASGAPAVLGLGGSLIVVSGLAVWLAHIPRTVP